MTKVFLKLLGSALSIWDSKEKTKYQDEYIELEVKYYAESNKPTMEEVPGLKASQYKDNAVLDGIDYKLRLLGETVATAIGKSNT